MSIPLPMSAMASAAAAASAAARRGIKGHVEEPMSTVDPDLPGWLVLQRTTNNGRSYKVRAHSHTLRLPPPHAVVLPDGA
jgi:hypothetical protein